MNRSIPVIIAIAAVLGATGASAQTYTKRGQGAGTTAPTTTNRAVSKPAVAPAPVPSSAAPRRAEDPRHHGHWERYYQHERHHRHHRYFPRWW